MGTGALGGGSGGLGGGGSGGGWGGRGSRGGRQRTDSIFERLMSVVNRTKSLNDKPGAAGARNFVDQLLRDPIHRKYLNKLLNDRFVQETYRRTADIAKAMSESGPAAGAQVMQFDAGTGSLRDLAMAIVDAEATTSTDERFADIVQRIITDLFLDCVDSKDKAFGRQPLSELGSNFSPAPLANTAGHYLAGLINGMVHREVRKVDPAVASGLYEAVITIANEWIDKCRVPGVRGRDILRSVAEDFPTLVRER